MRRAASLIMAAADANKLPAGGALAVDREGFAAQVTRALEDASADRDRARGDRGPAAGRLGQRDRGDGPPHLAGAGARHPGADRRSRARLLRRHRAHRASRDDRHVGVLASVALRQGGPGRRRRRLHQLPARQGPIRGLHRGAARRREDRLQGIRRHALFRGLPARSR